ncbi:MAG: glycosyltransferase [Pyrinomonadaceae bacterium]
MANYLSAADVLLLPSEQESFGLAALEAMACEVPVVATNVGGVPEVVTDGETGYLSAIGDVDKMAIDAARLLTDNDLRKRHGPPRAASQPYHATVPIRLFRST